MTVTRFGIYELDDARERVDEQPVWEFLSSKAYWHRWRSRNAVLTQIRGAWRIVGAYREDGTQAGFARALSDGVAVAYLADVYVAESDRGRGLGSEIVRVMIEEGPGAGFRWMLHTSDAHGLYRRFGFADPPASAMERPGANPPV